VIILNLSLYTNLIIKKSKYGNYKLIFFKKNDLKVVKSENESRNYDDESSKRAKRKILEIALNNDFEIFMTFTFDKNKTSKLGFTRSDFDMCKKSLLKAINNYNRDLGANLKYLMVPELHKNRQGVHFHMLATGFVDLKFLEIDKKTGNKVFYSEYFYNLFGRNFALYIFDYTKFVAYYISKYVTKDDQRIFSRRYFRSNGLQMDIKLYENDVYSMLDMPPWFDKMTESFQNGLVAIYDITEDMGVEIADILARVRSELLESDLEIDDYTMSVIEERQRVAREG